MISFNTKATSDVDLSETVRGVRISKRPKSTHMKTSVGHMISRSKMNVGKISGFVRIN